jgi:hypothetical protein
MQMFGYSTAEALVLKGATAGNHYLFDNEHGQLPMRCYMSNNGAVMFETIPIARLESEDDEYNAAIDLNVTDNEKTAIYEKQKTACQIHPKIIAELEERGVLLDKAKIYGAEESMKNAKMLRVKGRRTTPLAISDYRYQESEKLKEKTVR